MLTVTQDGRFGRRALLSIGSLGLGNLALTSLLGRRSTAAGLEQPQSLATGRSVIFLFQQGGPSQFETFDPKPDAPDTIRTIGDTVATPLPGVRFGASLPQLANLADKFAVVRSFQTENAAHNIQPIVGPATLNANMGSLYSSVAGAIRGDTGTPTNTVIFPQAVCSDVAKASGRGDLSATGPLGSAHAPFVPGGGGQLQKNLNLNLSRERFEDRRRLLADLNRMNRRVDEASEHKEIDRLHEQAYRVLLGGGTADALDLSKEDPRVVERYDTKQYCAPHNWAKAARGKRGYYTGHTKALGRQLLLARRLCEAGCGFVTIHSGYEGVWDMHADGENLNMADGMQAVGLAFDHAVAAFIEDLEARGLRDRILLVCCGEMGRTPKINRGGGRDHWAKLAPLLLYGGGTLGGRVVGQSTRDGGEPFDAPVAIPHLVSTVLGSLFDVGRVRVEPSLAAVSRLAEHEPMPGLN